MLTADNSAALPALPDQAEADEQASVVFERLLAVLAGCQAGLAEDLRRLDQIDWAALVAEAERQGVAALLLHSLESLGDHYPPPMTAALREQQWRTGIANLQAFEQVLDFAAALQAESIPVIALKGIHLAQVVYADISLRSMNDLDFLVRPADLPRVEAILTRLGYQPFAVHVSREWYLATHIHLVYYKKRVDTKMIEVHWRLVHDTTPYKLDMDGLWQRAPSTLVAETKLTLLAPEDLLLHLILQLTAQHLFDYFPVRLLCDVREIVHHYGASFDWTAFMARARQWGAANNAFLILYLANTLLGAAAPPDVLDALRPAHWQPEIAACVLRRMRRWTYERSAAATTAGFRTAWTAPDLPAKCRALVMALLPSPQRLRLRYALPPGIQPLLRAYPRHWRRIARQHITTAWQIVRTRSRVRRLIATETERKQLVRWLQPEPDNGVS